MKLWIARTKGGFKKGYLAIFGNKPIYNEDKDEWIESQVGIYISNFEFLEVTFENSPQEVEIKLANTGSDRSKRDSIIRGLKQLEHDYMLSYEEEIDWLNKLVEEWQEKK